MAARPAQVAPAAFVSSPVYAAPEAFGLLASSSGVTRALAPDARHRFITSLDAGMLLGLDVDQLGIDIVVEIRRAGESTRVVADDLTEHEGAEHVRFIAPATGEYDVEIRSEPLPGVTAGRYRLDLLPARKATDADRDTERRRADAEATLATIEKEIGNGVVQSPAARAFFERLDAVVNTFTSERMHRRRAAAMRLQAEYALERQAQA